MPRKNINTGLAGTSHVQDSAKAGIVNKTISNSPARIRALQLEKNSRVVDAGIIKSANTVRIPPICTASTMTKPKLK